MNHDEIDQELIAERYLLGRLPAEDEERFEEHFLECSECLDRLEAVTGLRDGLRQVAAEEAAATVVRVSLLARLRRSPALGMALAAALTVAVLPSAWFYRQLEQERAARSAALAPSAGTLFVSLSPERGLGEPSLRLDRGESRPLVVRLELARADDGPYTVTLEGPEGSVLWSREGVVAEESGVVSLILHTGWFAAGDYRIRLEGRAPDGVAFTKGLYPFRIQGS